jgi:RNA polymerase sigma factor (sigma-70 family)
MKELSQLVEAAQAGDSEAYAALVQRFQGMAYAIASRYVGDHHLAQDLVQDAIIEAFLHLPQLREPLAFPGWFRQIVFRQCTRLLRQANLPYSSLEAASAELVMESDPEHLVMQAEREATVRSALASLPRHEQLVTALFYGCGYSYNEVSTLLKIPITTVKKRLYSARQKLRMQLQTTRRDEIEQANERPASNDEAAEEAGRAISMARWLKRLAYPFAGGASRQRRSHGNCMPTFLPCVA